MFSEFIIKIPVWGHTKLTLQMAYVHAMQHEAGLVNFGTCRFLILYWQKKNKKQKKLQAQDSTFQIFISLCTKNKIYINKEQSKFVDC